MFSRQAKCNVQSALTGFKVAKGDKKKKSDTITLIGTVEIDLLPLIEAAVEFTASATLTPSAAEPQSGTSRPHRLAPCFTSMRIPDELTARCGADGG